MPFLYRDLLDEEPTYERIEAFGGGMDAFTRSTQLAPDASQYLENILIQDNFEARTRPGADSLGGLPPSSAVDASTTLLTAARNPVFITENVALTSTVTAPDATPTGNVIFYDGVTVLGTVALTAGVAVLTTSFASIGTKSLRAVYQGVSGSFTASSSTILSMLVYGATITAVKTYTYVTDPPDYHLVASTYDYGTVTITLTDEAGSPLSNLDVATFISGIGNVTGPAPIPPKTNSSGVITFTLASARSGVKTISVALLGRPLPQTATLTFYPGNPHWATSVATIPAGTVPADNSTTALISILVLDPNNNVCPGITVTITPIAGCTISAPAATDANGQTSATIKSSTPGTKTVNVIIPNVVTYPPTGNPGTIYNSPTVTFV